MTDRKDRQVIIKTLVAIQASDQDWIKFKTMEDKDVEPGRTSLYLDTNQGCFFFDNALEAMLFFKRCLCEAELYIESDYTEAAARNIQANQPPLNLEDRP